MPATEIACPCAGCTAYRARSGALPATVTLEPPFGAVTFDLVVEPGRVTFHTAPPTVETPVEPTVPERVRGVFTESGEAINVYWNLATNGGSPITVYRVYRQQGLIYREDMELVAELSGFSTNFVDYDLDSGDYSYRVSAVNAVGEGPRSIRVSAYASDSWDDDIESSDESSDREPEAYSPPSIEDSPAAEIHEGCACEACKFRKFGASKIHHALVSSAYSTPNGGWKCRGEGSYFLGVELETAWTEADGQSIPPSMAASLTLPADGFWFPKSDASVSGPEFCSMPATLPVWHSYSGELTEMFQSLVHAGYRSHDGGTAGMHVSFSRSAIDGTGHLFRLLTLIHVDPQFSVDLSQRSMQRVREWAKLSTYETEEARREYCAQVMPRKPKKCRLTKTLPRMYRNNYYYGDGNYRWCATHTCITPTTNTVCDRGLYPPGDRGISDRYVALNAPSGDHDPSAQRYEFRLPRGTLRLDRFYKNLEWVAAMIEFTRARHRKPTTEAFMRYVTKHATQYPNLLAFLTEKNLMPAAQQRKVAA